MIPERTVKNNLTSFTFNLRHLNNNPIILKLINCKRCYILKREETKVDVGLIRGNHAPKLLLYNRV